ncbi:MAG: hypothetical protein ACM3N6_01370 [Betaproteobacteria bacterium]
MSVRLPRLLIAWLAAGGLALKAAVPLLAATAALLQRVPVAQVCTLYGVATAQPQHGAHHHPHGHHHVQQGEGERGGSHSAADHGQDHCALTAVVAMAVDQAGAPPPVPRGPIVATPHLGGNCAVPDDCALWVARLEHGPPVRA